MRQQEPQIIVIICDRFDSSMVINLLNTLVASVAWTP